MLVQCRPSYYIGHCVLVLIKVDAALKHKLHSLTPPCTMWLFPGFQSADEYGVAVSAPPVASPSMYAAILNRVGDGVDAKRIYIIIVEFCGLLLERRLLLRKVLEKIDLHDNVCICHIV